MVLALHHAVHNVCLCGSRLETTARTPCRQSRPRTKADGLELNWHESWPIGSFHARQVIRQNCRKVCVCLICILMQCMSIMFHGGMPNILGQFESYCVMSVDMEAQAHKKCDNSESGCNFIGLACSKILGAATH